MRPPVDYSQGYPPHRRPIAPYRYSRDLVERGYQDHPCLNDKVAALGHNDAHKRPYFHPSNRGTCVSRNVRRRVDKRCSCAISHLRR